MVGRMAPGTGLPASIAALMMDAGDVTEKGVVAPEGCIDPAKFLAAFLKRGARIPQTDEKISSMLTLSTGQETFHERDTKTEHRQKPTTV
jgi:saccharopine dehydrogenase (NAD+, L-lysine-forming)